MLTAFTACSNGLAPNNVGKENAPSTAHLLIGNLKMSSSILKWEHMILQKVIVQREGIFAPYSLCFRVKTFFNFKAKIWFSQRC